MSEVREIRMEDENGNIYYPHNEAEVTFLKDGKTVQDFFDNGGKINGDLELPPIKKLKSRMSDGREVNIAYMQNNGAVTIGDESNPTFLVGATRPSVWEDGRSNPMVCLRDFLYSSASSGYTKLPNGLIIQWGDVQQTRTGWENFYPIQFPNACRVVIPISTSGIITFTLNLVGKTSFTVTASADLFGMRWLAIGY